MPAPLVTRGVQQIARPGGIGAGDPIFHKRFQPSYDLHHGQSGLTQRVRESTVDEAQASAALLSFLGEHTKKRKAPLAGNSIHQDRRFVALYLPEVEDWLHYRNVDVSTVKELGQRWYPKQYAGRPTKKGSHRAMDDVLESIEELKYYRKALFLPVDS